MSFSIEDIANNFTRERAKYVKETITIINGLDSLYKQGKKEIANEMLDTLINYHFFSYKEHEINKKIWNVKINQDLFERNIISYHLLSNYQNVIAKDFNL